MLRALASILMVFALAACATARPTGDMKRIAITFDDIPRGAGRLIERAERADMLRTALHEASVEQAAFFLNPSALQDRPQAIEDILAYVADGHVVANHSNSRPRLSQTDAEDYIADIDAAEAWISQINGHRPWFRYPFLDEGADDMAKRDACERPSPNAAC